MKAFYPIPLFPTVSVTGARCALNCPYCAATLLHGMPQAPTPRLLDMLLSRLEAGGARGVQISGGFDRRGRLPLDGFYNVISRHSGRLYTIAHQFLVNREEAERLAEAGVKRVDYPLTLDRRVLALRGLKASPRSVEESFYALAEAGAEPVPHILVGELAGRPSGEEEALRFAAEAGADLIVVIALTPLKGAPMRAEAPPSRVMELLRLARKLAPGEVALGCMRPPAVRKNVDPLAVKEGLIDRIVAPSPHAAPDAERYGACCSVDSGSLERFRLDRSSPR